MTNAYPYREPKVEVMMPERLWRELVPYIEAHAYDISDITHQMHYPQSDECNEGCRLRHLMVMDDIALKMADD